ncbi:MAG: hypothetical protein J0M12_12515 [Deltaproteobacteria bacterium]|nr:hypothetical protein [Deltaproteobacteria bacterium]
MVQLLRTNERGATLVEYALLLSLVAVLCMVSIRQTGSKSKLAFQQAALMGTSQSTAGAGPTSGPPRNGGPVIRVTHTTEGYTNHNTFVAHNVAEER